MKETKTYLGKNLRTTHKKINKMGNWFSKHAQQSRFLKDMPLDKDMTSEGGPHSEGPKAHGGEHPEAEFNYKSDMDGKDMTSTAGTFNTSVGTRGGNPQEVGNSVEGIRSNMARPDKRYTPVKGKVVGPATNSKSNQDRSVKGVNFTYDN
jgi:hypothetical protein